MVIRSRIVEWESENTFEGDLMDWAPLVLTRWQVSQFRDRQFADWHKNL